MKVSFIFCFSFSGRNLRNFTSMYSLCFSVHSWYVNECKRRLKLERPFFHCQCAPTLITLTGARVYVTIDTQIIKFIRRTKPCFTRLFPTIKTRRTSSGCKLSAENATQRRSVQGGGASAPLRRHMISLRAFEHPLITQSH